MTATDPFQDISADYVHAHDLGAAPLGARQIMLVPGSDVALLALDLPTGLRGQNREQVARRQLRDTIGAGADTAEMRPFQLQTNGDTWTQVLVADRCLIDTWRDMAGQTCHAVLPDYLALPAAPDLWTVASTHDGVAVRLAPDDGFGATAQTTVALLELALRDAKTPPKAVLCLGADLAKVQAWANTHDLPVITQLDQAEPLGLTAPRALAAGEAAMDLRANPQMARARLAKRVLPWRWPILLGLIAAGLWVTSQVVVMDRIKQETSQITANTTALVKQHFVKTGPILDARIQISQALALLRAENVAPDGAADPLVLFNQAAVVMDARKATLKSASYAGDNQLTLVLELPDFAAADQMAAALEQSGLVVTVVDTRVSDGSAGVRSELRVQAKPEAPE